MSKSDFREMLNEGKQILSPCVWDCLSARIAQYCGYNALMLSGGAVARFYGGLPDIGLITADDLVQVTERVCTFSDLPVIVDGDDGYGESPLAVWNLVKRLVHAGAQGIMIEDSTGFRGSTRWREKTTGCLKDGSIKNPVVSRKLFFAKIEAALDAASGSNCVIIARTEAKLQFGFDEALERVKHAKSLGADMALIMDVRNMEHARRMNDEIPGWKMWPNITSTNGMPDIDLDAIYDLGFRYITCHVLEYGAYHGMYKYGKHVHDERTTVWQDTVDPEIPQEAYQELLRFEDEKIWLKKEENYMNI